MYDFISELNADLLFIEADALEAIANDFEEIDADEYADAFRHSYTDEELVYMAMTYQAN